MSHSAIIKQLEAKIKVYGNALKEIIEHSDYTKDQSLGPDGEWLKKCYHTAIEAVKQFTPSVIEGNTYLIERYEGAEPYILVGKPVIDLAGRLEGWEDSAECCWTAFPDDKVYLLDLKVLLRITS